MTMRALAVSASLAVATVVAAPASAATYNNFDGTTGTYGNDGVSPTGPFTNTFTFVLDVARSASSFISSSQTRTSNIDFTSVVLTGNNGYSASYDVQSTGPFEFRTFGETILQAGTYTLTVTGTASGVASYAGDFTVASVPEPATWALMILGFGAVGGALRRRAKATVRFA